MNCKLRICLYLIGLVVGVGFAPGLALAEDEPPVLTGPAAEVEAATSTAFNWDSDVWQSIRSGNWELYYAPFGAAATQLTYHPAADTLPRLNWGATKVAFVSNRDGNDEI